MLLMDTYLEYGVRFEELSSIPKDTPEYKKRVDERYEWLHKEAGPRQQAIQRLATDVLGIGELPDMRRRWWKRSLAACSAALGGVGATGNTWTRFEPVWLLTSGGARPRYACAISTWQRYRLASTSTAWRFARSRIAPVLMDRAGVGDTPVY
jgi:hypothetical protein